MQLVLLLCILPLVVTSGQKCSVGSQVDLDLRLGEVTSYSDYVFERHLHIEYHTCENTSKVMTNTLYIFKKEVDIKMASLKSQLVGVIESPLKKYPIALQCTKQVFEPVLQTVTEGLEEVKECVDLGYIRSNKIFNKFTNDWFEYFDLKSDSLKEITNCFTVFTNCQKQESERCAKPYIDTFMSKGKAIADAHYDSPCMESFKKVAECMDKASLSIDSAVQTYVDAVFECAESVPDEVLRKNIAAQKPEKNRFAINSTLVSQIRKSQESYSKLNTEVEEKLKEYYDLEVEAKKVSLFEEKTEKELEKAIEKVLGPYLTAVKGQLCVDGNPKHLECIDDAIEEFDRIKEHQLVDSEQCDAMKVHDAKGEIADLRRELSYMVFSMSQKGNPSILDCITPGTLFKKYAVQECFELSLRRFQLEIKNKVLQLVEETIEGLKKHNKTYFGLIEDPLTCDSLGLETLILEADMALHLLEKCIYDFTGNDYNILPTDINPCSSKKTPSSDVRKGRKLGSFKKIPKLSSIW